MTTLHIHAPRPDVRKIVREPCRFCGKPRYMLYRHVAWYGADWDCLGCGAHFSSEGYTPPKAYRHQITAALARLKRAWRRDEVW